MWNSSPKLSLLEKFCFEKSNNFSVGESLKGGGGGWGITFSVELLHLLPQMSLWLILQVQSVL